VAGDLAEILYVGRRHPGEAFHPATVIPPALPIHADEVLL
jgi:hypothetical protein